MSKSRGLLDVSLIRGFWTVFGKTVTWVTSCNKECYFVMSVSLYSEVCENPTRGRSWFFHFS